MSVPSYPFHSLPLKFSNKRMDFPFPLLKLPNKGKEEYSKIILFIPFHFIPSSQTRPHSPALGIFSFDGGAHPKCSPAVDTVIYFRPVTYFIRLWWLVK